MAIRLGSTVINCADLERMTRFWTGALDLKPSSTDPDDDFRVLRGPAGTISLQLAGTPVRSFFISPGLVRTDMTESDFPDDAPWTPPELAPRLVRVLLSGRADALSGRYLHAEHDDVEELIRRADEIRDGDLNSIRLRR